MLLLLVLLKLRTLIINSSGTLLFQDECSSISSRSLTVSSRIPLPHSNRPNWPILYGMFLRSIPIINIPNKPGSLTSFLTILEQRQPAFKKVSIWIYIFSDFIKPIKLTSFPPSKAATIRTWRAKTVPPTEDISPKTHLNFEDSTIYI